MRHLDLFSGIGGFSLAATWAWGDQHEIVAFCEKDKYCQRVLRKHWPDVPIHEDIRSFRGKQGMADVITGGFPCQDLSTSGKQAGLKGKRSGLWSELCRIIREVGPRWAIVENVPNLLLGDNGGWFGTILRDLATIRYDAIWHCIPAAYVGAPHLRYRVWIIAYPAGDTIPRANLPSPTRRTSIIRKLGRDIAIADTRTDWQKNEPYLTQMDDGISEWVGDVSGYGNAIVPQVAYEIFLAMR